ncbi:MAG: nuclear transport factor 2 family protein [Chitinophagaceae bacterium]
MKLYSISLLILFSFAALQVVAQKNVSASVIKEVEQAESRMFQNMKYSHAKDYFKTDVADDFFTINADGVSAGKEQSLADTNRLKMVEMGTLKILDRKIRVYGNVGITNGRAQAFMNDTMIVEFLYTTVFVKTNGKWMYTSWQGTISKDSPKPPPMPQ